MTNINLLPWREHRREQQKRTVYAQLLLAGLGAILGVLCWSYSISLRLDAQHGRNAHLELQARNLAHRIKQLETLEQHRQQLLHRQRISASLQNKRLQMMRLLDALAHAVPDDVHLTRLSQKDLQLHISGRAMSNASVAHFMRRLSASEWLHAPVLQQTLNMHDETPVPYRFELALSMVENGEDGIDE